MLKKIAIIVLVLLTVGYAANAQEKCDKFTDVSLGISFCAPSGWTIVELPEIGKIIFAERTDGFSRTINVRGSVYPGTVAQAADAGVKVVLNLKVPGASKITFISKKPFTAGKSRGVKSVFKSEVKGVEVRSIQYYFSGKRQNKVIITATFKWSDPPELETLIDDAIKSFEVLK